MKIGIPRSLLYFRYSHLWESFFNALGTEFILSPDTNREIVSRGTEFAIDESCLSFKSYMGHVDWLRSRCDMIFVPRISSFGKGGIVCTRFQAIYDLVKNTFRKELPDILHYNIENRTLESEAAAFIGLGKALGKGKAESLLAYFSAKQAERENLAAAAHEQRSLLQSEGIKILVVAHPYNIHDSYIGGPVLRTMREMDAVPIITCDLSTREAVIASLKLSETMPWLQSRELLGAVALNQDKVDGIILMSTFPCGPDSMVNEVIIRRFSEKPILNLILDGQEGTAGLETRIESFLDIIKYKRNEWYG